MHSLVRTLRLGAFLGAGFAAGAGAAAAGGGAAGAWLDLGGGARAAAMANAFAALADDPSALFFNPAGLDQIPGVQAQLTYHRPYGRVADISYANAALSYNMSGRGFALGTFGAGVNYFRAGGIPEAGALGLTGRTFSDYEMALVLGWGKALGGNVVAGEEPRYHFGLAAKIISTKIYEYADGGFGLDAGFLFRPFPPVRVGVAFANVVAPNIELLNIRDIYPATARLAAAYDFAPGFVATVEGRVRKDGDTGVAVGGEAALGRSIVLRGGYRYPEKMPAAGLGVKVSRYGFDFCWRPHRDLGDSLVATVAAAW